MGQGLGIQLGLGGGRSATPSGAPAGSSWVDEKSVVFDGSDDYVSTGEAFDTLWSGSFTISLWYKTPTTFPTAASWGVVMDFIGNDMVTSKGYIEFRHNTPAGDGTPTTDPSKPELYFSVAATGSGNYNTYAAWPNSSDDYLAVNTWYHLCWTANRPEAGTTTSKLYINGDDITLTSTSPWLSTIHNSGWTASNNTQIGARNVVGATPPAELFLEGHLDELAFFDSALTSGQVTNIYKGEESGGSGGTNGTPGDLDTFDPVNWWRMGDGDTFPTLTDHGEDGNDGTMTNMTSGDIVAVTP